MRLFLQFIKDIRKKVLQFSWLEYYFILFRTKKKIIIKIINQKKKYYKQILHCDYNDSRRITNTHARRSEKS